MTSSPTTAASRTVWAAIIVIVAILVGAATGMLSAGGGVPVSLSVIAGGGAFGGTIGLLLTVANFLAGGKE